MWNLYPLYCGIMTDMESPRDPAKGEAVAEADLYQDGRDPVTVPRVLSGPGHSTRMMAKERHRAIIGLIQDVGSLRVGDLAEMFDVSGETVRRDLSVLEDQGYLTRTYGGAVADGVHLETSYQRRVREHEVEKQRMASMAAELVQEGSTIVIDSGTTMGQLARRLTTKRDLVVITNGLHHVDVLLSNPTLTLVVTGGTVRRATLGASGELAVATLQSLHADHTFIAAQGFSADAGMTYPSFEEVAVKRAMIAAGAQVTLLADGSKCGRTSMVKVAPLTELDRIITSAPIPAEEQERIRQLGVELLIADDTDSTWAQGALRRDHAAAASIRAQIQPGPRAHVQSIGHESTRCVQLCRCVLFPIRHPQRRFIG
jgi:DeoR family transcriptional regulator, fructose operon transcriptional repressor